MPVTDNLLFFCEGKKEKCINKRMFRISTACFWSRHATDQGSIWAASWENLLFAYMLKRRRSPDLYLGITLLKKLYQIFGTSERDRVYPPYNTCRRDQSRDTLYTSTSFPGSPGSYRHHRWCLGASHLQNKTIYKRDVRKTGLRGFRPGPTQTGLCSHRRWLEAWNFGFREKRKCTIQVAKTKVLISFAVTAKLICVFVFAYAKIQFSHVVAHII